MFSLSQKLSEPHITGCWESTLQCVIYFSYVFLRVCSYSFVFPSFSWEHRKVLLSDSSMAGFQKTETESRFEVWYSACGCILHSSHKHVLQGCYKAANVRASVVAREGCNKRGATLERQSRQGDCVRISCQHPKKMYSVQFSVSFLET